MQKLEEVETAKALMTEAMKWSVMKWLREKRRVRKTADQANAALDRVSVALRKQWPQEARIAYEAFVPGNGADAASRKQQKVRVEPSQSERVLAAKNVKEADDEAYRARMNAEAAFDEAERLLSTSLAREACLKAIHAWELHERAIQKAESIAR